MEPGFDLANPTEEHRMLRDMVRNFVQEEVEPQAHEHDRHEKFNADLFRKLGDLGLLGITIGEEYWGVGMDATAVAITWHSTGTRARRAGYSHSFAAGSG